MNKRTNIAFQSKADHPRMCIELRSYDLDLDLDLILDLDLNVRKMYSTCSAKNQISRLMHSEVRARTV